MRISLTRSLAVASLFLAVSAAAANKSATAVASELQPFVDNHTLAGAVTLVASRDQV